MFCSLTFLLRNIQNAKFINIDYYFKIYFCNGLIVRTNYETIYIQPFNVNISSGPEHFIKLQIWITDFPNERLSIKTLKFLSSKHSVQIISSFFISKTIYSWTKNSEFD